MFPVFLDMSGRTVVVVGGGLVGRRKALAALNAGAMVRVIALESQPAEFLYASLEWVVAAYEPTHLQGAALVFAAASAAVNAAVVVDAASRGLWVCDAVDSTRGNLTTPATVRAGRLTIAVGTGGVAPALTRRLAEKLRVEFDDAYAVWVDLLAELRPVIRDTVSDASDRRQMLSLLSEWHWLDRIRREGAAPVREAMQAVVCQYNAG